MARTTSLEPARLPGRKIGNHEPGYGASDELEPEAAAWGMAPQPVRQL